MPRPTAPHSPAVATRPKVLVAVGFGFGFSRDIISGVIQYAHQHGPWQFVGQTSAVIDHQTIEKTPDYDGVIFHGISPSMIRAVLKRGRPAVSVGGEPVDPRIDHVTANASAIARMGYDYFRQLGFERFAIYGRRRINTSMNRLENFAKLAAHDGFVCTDLRPPLPPLPPLSPLTPLPPSSPTSLQSACLADTPARPNLATSALANDNPANVWSREYEHLKKILPTLSGRVAIFTWSSEDARPIIAAGEELGIAIPDEMAVLGVDDDEAICELTATPISAIDHGCETIGWQAAGLLDGLMKGRPANGQIVRVDPIRVVERQSTRTLAIQDDLVVQALKYMQEHVPEGASVGDVMEHVGVSRPTLEHHFRQTLGRSIHRQLTLMRIELAKALLHATSLDLADITVRCGFSYPSKFSNIFRREVGQTPSQYRQSHRHRRGL